MDEPKLSEIWSDLAYSTGLKLILPEGKVARLFKTPFLEGIFRSFNTRVEIVLSGKDMAPYGSGQAAEVYTRITLRVSNPGHYHLEVGPKKVFFPGFQPNNLVMSRNHDFDRLITASGSPLNFVRATIEMILRNRRIFLEMPYSVTMLNGFLSWSPWNHPSIIVEKAQLICWQRGVVTDIKYQLSFMKLLCNIAELVEANNFMRDVQNSVDP